MATNEGEQMEHYAPMTETELDEIERDPSGWLEMCIPGDVSRFCRALRARHQEAELVRENLDGFSAPVKGLGGKSDLELSLAGRVFALGEQYEARLQDRNERVQALETYMVELDKQSKAKDALVEAVRGDRVDLSAYRSDLHVYGDPGTLCTALNVWSNQQPETGDYRKALKIASLYLESIWEALAALPAKQGERDDADG